MNSATANTSVQRQIALPLSKAVEIAFKSIRLRLSRSLLVTSGVVLALAFLVSILSTEAIVSAMRSWAVNAPADPAFAALRARRGAIDQQASGLETELRVAS